MNFDGVSCWVWVFSQAKWLLFEIVLDLLNTTGLWIKYLVVKRFILKGCFLCFWVEVNSVLLLYYQIAECSHFMFTICLSYFRSGLLLFMSSTSNEKINQFFLRFVFDVYGTWSKCLRQIWEDFHVIHYVLGVGCTHLPSARPLRRSTYNRSINFYNCDFVSFCLRFLLADSRLCLKIFY